MKARVWACVVGIVVAMFVAPGVWAETYYVHAQRGSDTRSAAEAANPETPWRSLVRVGKTLRSGDTVYGAGTFDDRLVRADELRNIRIEQWPGENPFVVRGSRGVTPKAWSRHLGNCYRAMIDGTPDIRGVVVLFGDPERRDVFGRHRGWLTKAANPDSCAATAYSYYWDGASSLYINVGGADPSSDPAYMQYPIEYALGGLAHTEGLIDLVTLTDSVIRGVTFRMSIHKADGSYLLGVAGTGNLIEECVFEHCSWHAVVVGRYGSLCSRNMVRGCVFKGFGDASGTPNPNLLTFYSGIAHVEGNVEEDNTYLCYGMLGYGGAPLDASFHVHGTYGHTGGQGFVVRNHERRRLVVRHFENPGWAMGCDSPPTTMPQGGREWDPAAYAIRHTDCTVYGGYSATGVANGSFLRCAFYMDNYGPRGGNKGCFAFDPMPLKCFFDACHISVNMYNAAQATNVFLMSQTTPVTRPHLLLRNTSIVSRGGQQTWGQRVFWWAAGAQWGQVSARGCVIASLNARAFVLAEGLAESSLSRIDLRGNFYFNIGPELWIRGHKLASSGTLFRENVDPPIAAGGDAVYDVAPGFVGDGPELLQGGGLATQVHFQANASRRGINGATYAGNYGAWQQQACAADFNGDGSVTSTDFFDYLFAFFEEDASADLNSDGNVNSQDLLSFYWAFFGGCE